MKKIIDRLVGFEERARRIYEKAEGLFPDDKGLTGLVRLLGEEEKRHCELIRRAAELTGDKGALDSIVSLDSDALEETEDKLLSFEKKLDEGGLTKPDLADLMVAIEYSELNYLFLYVMNSVRHDFGEFAPTADEFRGHRRHIERFLESDPQYRGCLERARELPDMSRERVLVVDDEEIIADIVKLIVKDEALVETAANGAEALEKMEKTYFAAVLSDVNMPVMNGMEFYRKAVERFPEIKDRFLFFTGGSEEHISFFRNNGLRYLMKPSQIKEIKAAVAEVMRGKR